MSVKCLLVGDVNGKFREVFQKLTALHSKNKFAFAIVAGDFFGDNEDQDEGELSDLLAGHVKVPLPVYFALGKQPLPSKCIEKLESDDGELCENLFFLGKRTTINTSEGIRIVALGGSHDQTLTADASKDKYLPFHSTETAKSLRGANKADILITSTWPKDILKGTSREFDGKEAVVEDETVSDLCSSLRPRYHFSTSATFFEREPFFHQPQESVEDKPGYQITRFISLAPFGNPSKSKFLYAFSIDPTASAPITIPPGTTKSPLTQLSKKRKAPKSATEEGFSRYAQITNNNDPHNHRFSKRRKNQAPPPGPENCFFCLSNANVDTNLITSIGEESYMTTAKGPLSTKATFAGQGLTCPAHMLIIPLQHAPTLTAIVDPESRRKVVLEMRRFRDSACSTLESVAEGKLGAVIWEVSRAAGIHTHWQFLPVRTDLLKKGLVEAAFKVEAENEKDWPRFEESIVNEDEEEEKTTDGDNATNSFRVWTWTPGPGRQYRVLRLPLGEGSFRFDLQFGRRVLAKLLGLEDRLQWRDCGQTEEEEVEDAEAWKAVFREWDFTL